RLRPLSDNHTNYTPHHPLISPTASERKPRRPANTAGRQSAPAAWDSATARARLENRPGPSWTQECFATPRTDAAATVHGQQKDNKTALQPAEPHWSQLPVSRRTSSCRTSVTRPAHQTTANRPNRP